MTEMTTDLGPCIMGQATEHPCRFAATEQMPRHSRHDYGICAYHAGIQPLYDEQDELGLALEKLPAYLKGARKNQNRVLVGALERVEADLQARLEFVEGLIDGLEAAEKKLVVYERS